MNEQAWEDIARPMAGSLVVLEPLDTGHEEGLYEAAGEDRAAWRWLPYDASESRGAFRSWLKEALAASEAGTEAAFATLDARSGRLIGSTRYLSLRPEHRGVEIGWTWLSPSAWGTGANVEAKLLMLGRAFGALGCMRVEFQTNARNERSRAALEALPARFEGVFRKHKIVQRGGSATPPTTASSTTNGPGWRRTSGVASRGSRSAVTAHRPRREHARTSHEPRR